MIPTAARDLKRKHTRVRVAALIDSLVRCIYFGERFNQSNFKDFSNKEVELVQRMVMCNPELKFSTEAKSQAHLNKKFKKSRHMSLWHDEENPWRDYAIRVMEECRD